MAFTGRNMSPMLRNRLVEELGINIFFTNCSQTGIHFCWGRYLAITKAIEQAQITSKAGSWPLDLPAYNEVLIVEVFISKSAWYNQKNYFATIKKSYSSMIEWLDCEASDEGEVWGDYREKFTLEDLKEFLDLGGRLKRMQRSPHSPNKGKGKSDKKYN